MWNLSHYIKDLNILKGLLTKYNLSGDFSSLDDVIESLSRQTSGLVDYQLKPLFLNLKGAIAGAVPKDLHFCKIELQNRFALKDKITENIDPLYKYNLDLKISLYKSEKDIKKEHCCTWHLDKEANESGHFFSYIHPYYHFQFGGKKHEYLDPDMAILSSPRIPHPPMDIILAFHFILNNFIDRKKYEYVTLISDDFEYQQIVKRSVKKLWEPYFKGYNSEFAHHDYKVKALFPLYLN